MFQWRIGISLYSRKDVQDIKHSYLTYFFYCSTFKGFPVCITGNSKVIYEMCCAKLTYWFRKVRKCQRNNLKKKYWYYLLFKENFSVGKWLSNILLIFEFQFMLTKKTINKTKHCIITYLTLFLFLQCKEYTSSKLCLQYDNEEI